MSTITASALLAFSIALPFGPVSLMCIERSLASGATRGLACGAGASTAHGVFATLAITGTNAVAAWLSGWQSTVHLLSSAILVLIGLRLLLKTAAKPAVVTTSTGRFADYAAGLMLALTNPATVLPYLALAGSGVFIDQSGLLTLAATVTGVLLGSTACYATLSGSVWALKDRMPRSFLLRLNLLAGPALIVMGLHMALAT
ncbi:LysE family translocator [Rhizobium sp. YIM 134829]|uniref:LysE family translocator n=1 Tax=Rhizobium sp. YIM 134829 TaxID=3390453 RepID=UPI00397C4580